MYITFNRALKPIKAISTLILAIATLLFTSSCSDENDEPNISSSAIVGSWYGTVSYYNPASGTKFQYLTITFESNGLGSLEYEAPTSYTAAKFTYTIKNGVIMCTGASANTAGEIASDFTLSLRIENDRLIPTNHYTNFILTRDNSVETDTQGNEIKNYGDYLYKVWIHSSKEVVLVLEDGVFTEYTLLSANSNIYATKTTGSLSYDYRRKYITIDYSRFNIISLTQNSLSLESESGKIFNYTAGTYADIPTNGDTSDSSNYTQILESHSCWSTKSGDINLRFYDSNRLLYAENTNKTFGSLGHISLTANAFYTISNNSLKCSFDNVYWNACEIYPNLFPGWTAETINYKEFKIAYISTELLSLTFDNGRTYYFYPV